VINISYDNFLRKFKLNIFFISAGITLSLTSVVLVDIAGLELLSETMGLNNVFSGVAALLGPPFAGKTSPHLHNTLSIILVFEKIAVETLHAP